MKKIIVIGSSGAGKTTLAKELSLTLSIPHTELDGLYHQANWEPTTNEKFIKQVKAFTNEPQWILCGNYYSKLSEEIWPQADTIIWCDYSFVRVFGRLLRRTFTRSVAKTELWSGNYESFYTNFFTKDSILVWTIKTWKKQKSRYNQLYNNPDSLSGVRLVRIKTPKDMRELLQNIQQLAVAVDI
jgi:adenylate kinase family enzyme